MTRTLSRDEYRAMTEAWAEFDYRWKPWRELAKDRGIYFPPSGSKHDSIEDPEPSQRAIVFQAITDTPAMLRDAIARSRNWREVVGRLLLGRERLREDADFAERDARWDKGQQPTPAEARETIGGFLRKMADSIGVDHAA